MKGKFKNLIIMIGLFVMFAFGGYYNFRLTANETDLSSKVLGWGVSYFCLYLSLTILFSKNKNRFIDLLLKILGFPILLVILVQYYLAPIVTIVMFIVFYISPTAVFLNLSNVFSFLNPYLGGIIYLVNVLAVLAFAYFGNSIMKFVMSTFKTKLAKGELDKYSTVMYTRIYSYVLMIVIYVIYNFMSFSNSNLLGILPIEPVSVIKEVFVTFVAVDTLIQIFLNKKENTQSTIELSE
ncbi:hypothetical protein [Bacillus sp. SYJ]|uniref:hypothetical protein n=1 Tax=Bacillus sp. SYJ TaxID=2529386 RepID=UPI0010364965|nr:hypothetical protein [Bacillus sp. SYJ]